MRLLLSPSLSLKNTRKIVQTVKTSLISRYQAPWGGQKFLGQGKNVQALFSMWTEPLTDKKSRYVKHRGEKKTRGVNRKQRKRPPLFSSLNPFLSSALFPVVKDTDQGLPLDAGFTSLPSVWLWRSYNVKFVKKKKKSACMSSFKEKVWVCRAPLEMSTLSESRIPGIPGH